MNTTPGKRTISPCKSHCLKHMGYFDHGCEGMRGIAGGICWKWVPLGDSRRGQELRGTPQESACAQGQGDSHLYYFPNPLVNFFQPRRLTPITQWSRVHSELYFLPNHSASRLITNSARGRPESQSPLGTSPPQPRSRAAQRIIPEVFFPGYLTSCALQSSGWIPLVNYTEKSFAV